MILIPGCYTFEKAEVLPKNKVDVYVYRADSEKFWLEYAGSASLRSPAATYISLKGSIQFFPGPTKAWAYKFKYMGEGEKKRTAKKRKSESTSFFSQMTEIELRKGDEIIGALLDIDPDDLRVISSVLRYYIDNNRISKITPTSILTPEMEEIKTKRYMFLHHERYDCIIGRFMEILRGNVLAITRSGSGYVVELINANPAPEQPSFEFFEKISKILIKDPKTMFHGTMALVDRVGVKYEGPA